MKKLKPIYSLWLCLLLGSLFAACEKTNYPTYETDFTGIYFTEDSIRYSFGVTPLGITSYSMKLPVRIMGTPVDHKRSFKVEIIAAKTSAKENVHYKMPAEYVIEADSINGFFPLEILREELGDSLDYHITFKLTENEYFVPIPSVREEIRASFTNVVEPPNWKDFDGYPTWPDYKLGLWNPIVWVKFMEYFRLMEETHPATYKAIVEVCGPNLENVEYGWPWDFDVSLTKYVLIPMYSFFQEHPEYGVEMPDPNA